MPKTRPRQSITRALVLCRSWMRHSRCFCRQRVLWNSRIAPSASVARNDSNPSIFGSGRGQLAQTRGKSARNEHGGYRCGPGSDQFGVVFFKPFVNGLAKFRGVFHQLEGFLATDAANGVVFGGVPLGPAGVEVIGVIAPSLAHDKWEGLQGAEMGKVLFRAI